MTGSGTRSVDGGASPVLAVDLGGTKMRAAIVDSAGRVFDHRVAPTPQRSDLPDALVADVPDGNRVPVAVVGVPGRVHDRDRRLDHARNLPAGWLASPKPMSPWNSRHPGDMSGLTNAVGREPREP